MNLIPGIDSTASALGAEKMRLDLIAQNIANANTTRDADGNVYQRKMALFESHMDHAKKTGDNDPLAKEVRIAGIHEDQTPGIKVHLPNHPHADDNGMVTMPNVQLSREMVDLISASRAYEANLSVISTARQMAHKTIMIGK